jgi:hypothetical protein
LKRRVSVTLVALAVVYLAGTTMAQAQTITGEVAFPFVAGGKDVPAGKYTVEKTLAGPMVLTGSGGVRIMMPIITTLARHAQDQQSGFVFDKTSGKSILSEIWMSGYDGLLLVTTSEPHQHAIVAVPTPKK